MIKLICRNALSKLFTCNLSFHVTSHRHRTAHTPVTQITAARCEHTSSDMCNKQPLLTFNLSPRPGVDQPAAGVQSVATGGATAVATYHQHSYTKEDSQSKGHSTTHRVWRRQWRGDTGMCLTHRYSPCKRKRVVSKFLILIIPGGHKAALRLLFQGFYR